MSRRTYQNFDGLSDLAREGIFANLRAMLGTNGDHYRLDESLRVAPGSPMFWVELSIFDAEMGRGHRFRFLVTDEYAVYGILAVIFSDTGRPAPPVF